MKKKRHYFAKITVLLHHDNARIHAWVMATTKFHQLGHELLTHQSYSPDFALSDYFLFPILRKWFGGKSFRSNDRNHRANKRFLSGRSQKLEKCWMEWMQLKENYVVLKKNLSSILKVDLLTYPRTLGIVTIMKSIYSNICQYFRVRKTYLCHN